MRTTPSAAVARARRGLRLGAGPRRELRLGLARHRRPLFVLVLLAATWLTIRSAAPSPEPVVEVAVAAHDLPAGAVLSAADLRTAAWPVSIAPSARVAGAHATGQTLATPVPAGEAITVSRLLGPGLLARQPAGSVAVTVRVADPASLVPIQAGDRIDVLAAGAQSSENPAATPVPQPASGSAARLEGDAEHVALRALVLSRPIADGSENGESSWAAGTFDTSSAGAGTGPAGVLVLAVDPQTATRLSAAASSQPLSVILLGHS